MIENQTPVIPLGSSSGVAFSCLPSLFGLLPAFLLGFGLVSGGKQAAPPQLCLSL